MSVAINVKNVVKKFGNNVIIPGMSIDIKNGEFFTLLGPSGCGKTTFLKTLNSIISEEGNPEIEGEIFFKGKNIKDIDEENLRKNIGLVFQTPTPFPFSIYKNMTYVPVYYGITDKKELDSIVKEKLETAGLYEEVKNELNKSALKLSGGQQQRLCIARSLTAEPEIILLDEPCSALDIQNTEKIEQMLLNLSEKYTIIIVTHNLFQAKRISDYTAFFLDGGLVEFNKTEKIFSNPSDERTKNYIKGIYG